jgi:hypothetical protein
MRTVALGMSNVCVSKVSNCIISTVTYQGRGGVEGSFVLSDCQHILSKTFEFLSR